MRWHPDVNKNNRNAEERFKWINEAYLVLSDPKKRFEWEIAGRPTFHIQEFAHSVSHEVATEPEGTKSSGSGTTFSSAEKLLLIFISTISLFLLNTFLS